MELSCQMYCIAAPGDHLVDILEQLVAFRHRHRLVDPARDGPGAVDPLAGGDADHLLAKLAQQHALTGDLRMLFRNADDAAPGKVGVETEQQIGRAQVEEVQRV